MCIAIMIPKGTVNNLTQDILEECYLVNSDGIGYAFPDGEGNLITKKFMSFDEFLLEWDDDKGENDKYPIMLHFRATSVGDTDLDNCHPFSITDTQSFCHNGTIAKVDDDPQKKASDTRMFNRLFLRDMPEDWEFSYSLTELIKCYIGTSKLIIINADESYSIVNEGLGVWDNGIWFSNEHYTGDYTRGNGIAYKKTIKVTNSYNTYYSERDKKKKEVRERWKKERANAYNAHPQEALPAPHSSNSSEVMCDFCNTPYDESELILVEWGNTEEIFSVCHVCINKIHFDSK